MAFKAIDRSETIRVVAGNDPAINLEESDLDAYAKDYDVKHLTLVDEPTWFTLGTIGFMQFSGIKDKHISFDVSDDGQEIKTNLFGLTADALRYSLKKIENAPFDLKFEHGHVSDRVMNKLAGLSVVEELGNIALNLNGFGETDEKKS